LERQEDNVAIRVYDTFDAKKKDLIPVQDGKVAMYMCGMTVQDKPHVGHMYAFVCSDTIRRYLEFRGYEVTYVQNFTDVDDKIIARANAEGVDYTVIAERYTADYFRYADMLNIKEATIHPKATEHMQDMIDLVNTLVSKGLAYEAGGDVYFEVARFPRYGGLSKKRLEDLRAGARIEVGEHKRSPMDFALWKAAKEGEPYWDSPWGRGRPGWHIECSAMSMKYLGKTFDIHGGGTDLIFPHHENEVAQAEGSTGQKYVNYWMHNGLLNLAGEKMSKSTGHFFAMEDIAREFEPDVIRFYLISTHYRSPVEFSRDRLKEARSAVNRMRNTFRAVESYVGDEKPPGSLEHISGKDREVWDSILDKERSFIQAMDDDFNTAGGIGYIFEMAKDINNCLKGEEEPAKRLVLSKGLEKIKALGDVLGIFRGLGGEIIPISQLDPEVADLVDKRNRARGAKEWVRADEIRNRLGARGYFLEDRPEGTIVRK
jgi:cysteinyl-tRNA synthetase